MEEGLGPCVVAAVGELSQEEAGPLTGLGPFSAAPPGFETRLIQDTRYKMERCGPVSGGVTYGKHLFCTIFTVQFKLL